MQFSDIPVPEAYTESADFRFFLKWFEYALTQIKYDTENLLDLYDPQRCPAELLWLLADTMGYKFDDRLPVAFNRLVLLYFMSMIYHKGSKNGVTLAAEVNLAQFNIQQYGKENEIMYNRLEDTSIPVNSVYVTPHTAEGYIDVVYFSASKPVDACIEYVRPLGMYCFQHEGVRVDARTKISIDARLTDARDLALSIGPTHVGHYRRDDYASLQRMSDERTQTLRRDARRYDVYYRNSDAEGGTNPYVNPGYRALYSLQLSNNENIVKALIPHKDTGELVEPDAIFSLGYGPQDVSVKYPDNYLNMKDYPEYNLRYDREMERRMSEDLYTVDSIRSAIQTSPMVNPVMMSLGDAIAITEDNTSYSKADGDGTIERVDS